MPMQRRLFNAGLLGLGAGLLEPGVARAADGRTTDTVRLGFGLNGLPLLAKQRGEFARRLGQDGIKVAWVGPFPAHAPSLQAVVGGSADFTIGGSSTPALAALIAGSPLVFTQFGLVEPRTTAIIAKDGSGIDHVADLAGRSVAVNRSGLGEFLLIAALEKHGIDRSRVRMVYLNPSEAAPAFASGQVDAWSMWSPAVDIARPPVQGPRRVHRGAATSISRWTSARSSCRRDLPATTPPSSRAVNAAFLAEADWASQNPADAEQLAQAQAGYDDVLRDEYVRLHRRYVTYSPADAAFVARFQRAADWLVKRRVLPEPITVGDHLATLSA